MSCPEVEYSKKDKEQVEIAVRFITKPGHHFDREGAEKAGLEPQFAKDFEDSFHKTVQKLNDPSTPSEYKQPEGPSAYLFPAWFNCAVAIASLVGVSIGMIAGMFASGGSVTLVLASYGLSSAGVIGSCYDENGNPIV